MVPDTTLRLRTALKALEDIVSPALPAEAAFAHEQLALIRKSLQLVIDQIPHEYAFMVKDAHDHLALAQGLVPRISCEDSLRAKLVASAGKVSELLPASVPVVPALVENLRALKQELEDAVDTLCATSTGAELAEIEQLVLDHSARRIIMERAWTVATGFETEPSVIPPVTELVYRERTA